jgi:protein-S-isoprenylcysteine O-methyltransferase Ste14
MSVGRFLFRWRGVIGGVAYLVVLVLGRPTVASCLQAVPFLAVALALRFWAMGFIGIAARASEVEVERRVTGGPYRLLRHPLYVGNLLLVLGVLAALRPALVPVLAVAVLFLVEYGLIIAAEEKSLAGVQRTSGRFSPGNALHEWRTWLATAVAWGLALAKAARFRC